MTPTTLTNHRHTPHPQHKAHQTQLTLPRTLIGRVPRVATKSIQNKNPGRGGTENRCFIWHRRDKDVWLTSTDKIPAHRVRQTALMLKIHLIAFLSFFFSISIDINPLILQPWPP